MVKGLLMMISSAVLGSALAMIVAPALIHYQLFSEDSRSIVFLFTSVGLSLFLLMLIAIASVNASKEEIVSENLQTMNHFDIKNSNSTTQGSQDMKQTSVTNSAQPVKKVDPYLKTKRMLNDTIVEIRSEEKLVVASAMIDVTLEGDKSSFWGNDKVSITVPGNKAQYVYTKELLSQIRCFRKTTPGVYLVEIPAPIVDESIVEMPITKDRQKVDVETDFLKMITFTSRSEELKDELLGMVREKVLTIANNSSYLENAYEKAEKLIREKIESRLEKTGQPFRLSIKRVNGSLGLEQSQSSLNVQWVAL